MLSLTQLFKTPLAPVSLLLPRLQRKQCLQLEANAGQRLVAQSRVWLTQAGLDEDVVLMAGQSWIVVRDGRVVVQGL
jgi:hypothetical protein